MILKAVDRSSGRIMAWVIDGGYAQTFARRYEKVNHLTDRIFDTDDWRLWLGEIGIHDVIAPFDSAMI